jgi:transposase
MRWCIPIILNKKGSLALLSSVELKEVSPMKKEYYDYLKFIDDALEVAKSIPRYFSKFSNKIYCNHQKMAIFVLMQRLKTTTRGIISILRASSDMRLHLGLHRVPVHTTIVRFVNKIRKHINKLLGIRQADTVAVDATGFELEQKSYYYRTVWNHKGRRKIKKFMKLSIAVDCDKQLILSHKARKSYAHDTRDFKYLVKDLKTKNVCADKGYDSKELRKFVVLRLNARPHIPYRKFSSCPKRGPLIIPPPDKKVYPKRLIVENIFFCIKQKYGSILRNRTCATQKVELMSKMIAHNVDRIQHYFLIILEGCTSALKSSALLS